MTIATVPEKPETRTSRTPRPTLGEQSNSEATDAVKITASAARARHGPDTIRGTCDTGEYPYHTRLRRSAHEKNKARLQVELLKTRHWVKETGQRIVILLERRDASGKGSTIKRFIEHLHPRGARVIALVKLSQEEPGQWFFQRCISFKVGQLHRRERGDIFLYGHRGHPLDCRQNR